MRICLISQQIGEIRTGVGTYANNLIPALAQAGHQAVVIGRGGSPEWPGVEYHTLPSLPWDPIPERWLSFSWYATRLLHKLNQLKSFDLIHFLDAREAFFSPKHLSPLLGTVHDCYFADASRSPFYWKKTYQDWLPRYLYHQLARPLERRSLRKLDLIITNSHYVQRAITQRYRLSPDTVRTIYYGFSFPWQGADVRAQIDNSGKHHPQVLFVGGNFQRKGLPTLLRAVAQLKEHLPAIRLHVIGDNPARERMVALTEELGLSPQVTFFGALPYSALAPLYRAAQVFALPSDIEGFGITLLEAMYLGVPVIGSARGGSQELIRDGWNGYLVEPGDVSGLAEKLLALLVNHKLREEIGAHGQRTAEQFTRQRMVEETLGVYNEIVNRSLYRVSSAASVDHNRCGTQ
jgi:glycosyltransferase involved in cell wall biosynthesis